MPVKLSVTIITKNEEKNIGRCLESLEGADEIVVVDSGSTDKTLEICRSFDCRIVETEWLGFGKTKQFAVNLAANDWILSIDADEELSPGLKREIIALKREEFGNKAYRIKRSSFYLGKMIRFCGWQTDAPLRIFNRLHGNFNDKPLHESVVTKQQVTTLKNRMYHYTYPTLESHFTKMRSYGDIAAQYLHSKGKKSCQSEACLRGVFKFLKMFILQLGFLDGLTGYKLCKNSAWGIRYKYQKLAELNR
jgi:glycosyltransferase involved in cell wall biosynthesis